MVRSTMAWDDGTYYFRTTTQEIEEEGDEEPRNEGYDGEQDAGRLLKTTKKHKKKTTKKTKKKTKKVKKSKSMMKSYKR